MDDFSHHDSQRFWKQRRSPPSRPPLAKVQKHQWNVLAVDAINATQLKRCSSNRMKIKNSHVTHLFEPSNWNFVSFSMSFSEIRTLKSSALLVFVWKPPHLSCWPDLATWHLTTNALKAPCGKNTQKPKRDKGDKKIKISAPSCWKGFTVVTVVHNIFKYRPVQAMCTITSLRSGQMVGGSSSDSHGNLSAWQKNWKHLLLKEKVDQRWPYPMIPLYLPWWDEMKGNINGKRRTQHLKNPTHIKDTALS